MGRKESNQKTQAGKNLNANGAKISFRLFISLEILTLNRCQCCLLITSANNLDPDQAQLKVGPDLGPNVWHSDADSIPERIFRKG